MSTAQVPAIDANKLNAFIGQFVTDLGAAVHAGMVVIGEKLGLYKALAGGPISLNSEVELDRTTCPRFGKWFWGPVRDQVMSDGSNFGEVGICHCKMLSSKGILVFSPPQLSDR